jgi:hypothetical protein
MPSAPITSPRVIRKAAPALLLALFIFLSLMIVARYTEAIFLVVLLWIILPVMAVQLYRKVRDRLKREK